MVDIPLRTKNVLTDAQKLEKEGFYSASILLYIQYLEQMMLVATIQYYESNKPKKLNKKLEKIIRDKDKAKLDFKTILSHVPVEIRDAKTKNSTKYVKHIRDTMAAHSYFIVSLDKRDKKKRAVKDVNNHKKIIRRLYKLIRKEYTLDNVSRFLSAHPFSIRKKVEEDAYEIEKIILEKICQITGETVVNVTERMLALSRPLDKFSVKNE